MDTNTPLEIRPSPPEPTRLNRRAGWVAMVVLGLLLGAIVYGVSTRQSVQFRGGEDNAGAESATNAGHEIAMRIGEGNLAKQPDLENREPPPAPHPTPTQVAPNLPSDMSPEERLREEAWQREQSAMRAPTSVGKTTSDVANAAANSANPLLALMSGLASGQAGVSGPLNMPAPLSNPLGTSTPVGLSKDGLGTMLAAVTGGGSQSGEDYRAQNNQAGKIQFNNAVQAMDDNYLKAARNAALSPYEIKAGWDIPAVLDQGVNSDLPGEMHALVRENVYDTATGKFLLIPKGSRVLGAYNSDVSFGQERVQVVWNRLVFPDGSSINLGSMIGQDRSGYAGFHDQINNHWGRVIAGAVLTSLFSTGYEISQRRRDNNNTGGISSSDVAAASVGMQVSQVGSRLTERNLNIQPTLEIRPGYRFNIRVNKDMLFGGPYSPMPPLTD